MKFTKLLPIILFAFVTISFGVLYVVSTAYAHGTTVDVSSPGISWSKNGSILEVNTAHGWSFSSSHNVTARVDIAHTVPEVVSNNGTNYYSCPYGNGAAYLYSSHSCPSGNHTIFATSDIEADYMTDNAYNSTSFTF